MTNKIVATFSIVGFDPATEELGIAVQSKFLAVGSAVPWVKAKVGAIATQSYANTGYGPQGLELLASGKSATETLELLLDDDEGREKRQVGIVDAKGRSATFTGKDCYDWAGGIAGSNFAAQGNILVGEATVKAMADTFQSEKGCLAERLLKALDAGQAAGGDSRGKQSAALYVAKENGGYGGFNDRAVDLRVDDHIEPIKELFRIYNIHKLYFGKPDPADVVKIDRQMEEQMTNALKLLGFIQGDAAAVDLHSALSDFMHTENFEERLQAKGYIDKSVLTYLVNRSRIR